MRRVGFLVLGVLAACSASAPSQEAASTLPATTVHDAADAAHDDHATDDHPAEPAEPVELPAEFPSAVPIPTGLTLHGAEVLEGRTRRLFDVTGWHAADPVVTGSAYLRELEALGYEVTSQTDADTSVFFVAEGPDWLVSAGFFPDPVRLEGASVGITVSPRTG